MHGAQNTCLNAYHTLRKILTFTRACTPLQRCRNIFAMEVRAIGYCELHFSFARASCRLSFAARPAARPTTVLTKSVAWCCLLKKFVQIHASSWRGCWCSVAQASFDHPRWYRPHPCCLWVALALGRGPHHPQSSIFAMVFAGFVSLSSSALVCDLLPRRLKLSFRKVRQHYFCQSKHCLEDTLGL